MPSLLFYFFAAITLFFGVGVIVARNPVASALSLVLCFVGVAALFISLDAYFIGTIQILVYAGAVMVLFLFIIMLLDIKAEEVQKPRLAAIAGGVFLAAVIVFQTFSILQGFKEGQTPLSKEPLDLAAAADHTKLATIQNDLRPGDAGQKPVLPDAKLMGQTLFHKYPFHLQAVGLLLLAGTVGVVVLSRRDKEDAS